MIEYVGWIVLPVLEKNLGKYCRVAKGVGKDSQKHAR